MDCTHNTCMCVEFSTSRAECTDVIYHTNVGYVTHPHIPLLTPYSLLC